MWAQAGESLAPSFAPTHLSLIFCCGFRVFLRIGCLSVRTSTRSKISGIWFVNVRHHLSDGMCLHPRPCRLLFPLPVAAVEKASTRNHDLCPSEERPHGVTTEGRPMIGNLLYYFLGRGECIAYQIRELYQFWSRQWGSAMGMKDGSKWKTRVSERDSHLVVASRSIYFSVLKIVMDSYSYFWVPVSRRPLWWEYF